MSNWFKKADFYLRTAEQHYKDAAVQDEDYNIALTCYFLQQSIEFNIKGLIEYYCDSEFEKSHNISNNLVILEREKDKVKDYDNIEWVLLDIDNSAQEISSWNSESRYNFNFVKTRAMVQKVMNMSRKLNTFTSSIYKIKESEPNIAISVLYKIELDGRGKKECYKFIRKLLREKFGEDVPENLTYFITTFGRKMIEDLKVDIIKYHIYNSDNLLLKTRTYNSFEEVIDDINKCNSLEQFISNER